MKVFEKYRVWHDLCHLDDALMAPEDIRHFDGYNHGKIPEGFVPFQHIDELDKGGWHDAGDYDFRIESLTHTILALAYAYEELSKVSNRFTIAASFGNVHGVYKPGNVVLTPEILKNSQTYIQEKYGTGPNPVNFVFHGGSGSELSDIREAISYGAVKMNIDTDTQWAFWDGVRNYVAKYHDYLQGQIGNPEGDDKPNKKYYDPRKWLRVAEESTVSRLEQAFDDLNCIGRN